MKIVINAIILKEMGNFMKKQVTKKRKVSILLPSIMIILTFALLYMSIPKVYDFLKEREYKTQVEELVQQLSEANDVQEIINSFAIKYQSSIIVTNNKTNKVLNTATVSFLNYVDYSNDYTNIKSESMSVKVRFSKENSVFLQKILAIILPTFAAFSIIVFYIYCKIKFTNVDNIMEDLVVATDKMIELNPAAKYRVDGEQNTANKKVADNINEIYNQLLYSIEILETKIKDNTEFEQATLAVLKKTTKIIEAPIEEIKTIVNGMIRNQGAYKNHQIFLLDTRMKLDQLATIIKKVLENPLVTNSITATIVPIDIKDYFNQLLEPYNVMSLVKKVEIKNEIEPSFDVQFNPIIFPRAISHILNYAYNHCESGKELTIRSEKYNIIIEYEGDQMLSRDALSELIISDDLSLANKLFYQLKIPMDFDPGSKPNTMCFTLHF